MQAKELFTKKRSLIACSLMPLLWLAVYSWIGFHVQTNWNSDTGQTTCDTADIYKSEGEAGVNLWTCFYIYIPAALLVLFNIAIIVKLHKARKIHKILREQCAAQSLSYRTESSKTLETTLSSVTTTVYDDAVFSTKSSSSPSISSMSTSHTDSKQSQISEQPRRINVKSGLR